MTAADKHYFQAIRKGNLWIKILNGWGMTTVLLKDILYCPDIGLTLVSIGKITATGYKVIFETLLVLNCHLVSFFSWFIQGFYWQPGDLEAPQPLCTGDSLWLSATIWAMTFMEVSTVPHQQQALPWWRSLEATLASLVAVSQCRSLQLGTLNQSFLDGFSLGKGK